MLASQAVILCGGRGTRLRPLTDTIPKPMVPVLGRPFLEHLLQQLRDNGIKDVVLLTGYLGEVIEKHFGDGSALGMKISYSRGPAEWDTGKRLWEAKPLLDNHFYLLYGDNYAAFQALKVEEAFLRHGLLGCLSLHARSKNANICYTVDGLVQKYDRSRQAEGLNAVEIGYMLLSRNIFEYFKKPDCSFSEVLELLAKAKQLSAYLLENVYYSVSDPERLKITEKYLVPKKILLIDRDGTINQKAPRGEYITRWEDFHLIPKTMEGMKNLSAQGWSFVVISNQAGVGRGVMTENQVWEIDQKMVTELTKIGIKIMRSYYCFHHWIEKCSCRKPSPGMFFQAAKEYNLRLSQSIYVGDDERDCQAAANAGCGMAYISSETKPPFLAEKPTPYFMAQTLEKSVDHIIHAYNGWKSRI